MLIRLANACAKRHCMTLRSLHADASKLLMSMHSSSNSGLDAAQLSRIPVSLQKVRVKELNKLAQDIGLPNSGTKAQLADRISAHFSRLLMQIDTMLGETKAKKWIETSATSSQEEGNWYKSSVFDLLPVSIISIDIGVRNLAWVQLSRQGEVLRWETVDLLLADSDSRLNESDTDQDDPEPQSSKQRKRPRQTTSSRRPPAVFDSPSLAVAIDNMMCKILEQQPDAGHPVGAVVMERQRLRTASIPGMVDGVVKSCVVEGMLLAWLTHWRRRHRIRNQQNDHGFDVDLMSPRAVGSWWGIGEPAQKTTKSIGSPLTGSENTSESDVAGTDSDITDQSWRTKYASKKAQSTMLVTKLLASDHTQHQNDSLEEQSGRLCIKCPENLQIWYNKQSKKDDLSDCLLQAVAWYEWRARAIGEARRWYLACSS